MKRFLIAISLIFLSAGIFAQDNYGPWTLLQEQNNVKVYRSYASCDGDLMVVLKIENNNGSQVSVSFDSAFNLSGNLFETDHSIQMIIPAAATSGGSCDDQNLSLNPYNFVSSIQLGVSDYIIQNLQIQQQ